MGYYSGTIRKGSTGDDVKKWQEYLNTQGHNLTVDGIFGDNTLNATTAYQTANGLSADGIVGDLTWGKAGFKNINTPVSAPTATPMPTAPTYDNTSYGDTQKGQDAWNAYQNAQNAVNNYGPFQYANMEQFQSIMDAIMNRDKFSYDFNGDALYQQYKDKYIKQGKMAMGDAIGQASAMTGGYGNSYAQSVGQQAYQAQLENLNDVIPQLYQMALDKYNMEGQELLNQYGMLSDDYNRAYGEHQDGYNKLMDALGLARGDYYDGADMFYTEQGNKNSVLGQEFDDAMSLWQNENTQAWKQAEWEEAQRQYEIDQNWKEKEFDLAYGNTTVSPTGKVTDDSTTRFYSGTTSTGDNFNNGTLTTAQVKALQAKLGVDADGYYGEQSKEAAGGLSADEAYAKFVGGDNTPKDNTTSVPENVRTKLTTFKSNSAIEQYLESQYNAGNITYDQMGSLLLEYEIPSLSSRDWALVDDGGINWFGGVDNNAKVKDQYGNTYKLSKLVDALVAEGMSKSEAKDYVKELQKSLGA